MWNNEWTICFKIYNIFSEGPRFDPGLWHFESWIYIKNYFYFTFFIICVIAQLVDDWSHKSDVMSSNLPDTIKNVFFKRKAPSALAARVKCLNINRDFPPIYTPSQIPTVSGGTKHAPGWYSHFVGMARDCALTHSATRLHSFTYSLIIGFIML